MNKTIQFKQSPPDANQSASPWTTPARSSYKDLILKPEFAERQLQFSTGETWLRVIPALKSSTMNTYLGVHALGYQEGRHCHPRTVSSTSRSVFDKAYTWLQKHDKDSLFCKANKEGYRLLTDPLVLMWVITEVHGKTVARLLLAKAYDGSRGGVPGLGHQIWSLSKDVDEDGALLGDPADPELGVQICVTKKQVAGAKYPSYSVKRGRVPAPIGDICTRMEEDEVNALAPLENVVHLPSEEEEWSLLENVIDADTVRRIRESID